MAIRMSDPFIHANDRVRDEIQDVILRRGGSSDLARVVLASNEYARDKSDENRVLLDALRRMREKFAEVLRMCHERELLSVQQCASMMEVDLVTMRRLLKG